MSPSLALALAGLAAPAGAQLAPPFQTHYVEPAQFVGLVVATGEFTGDGLPDAAISADGRLRILTGDGQGNLSASPVIEISGVTLDGLTAGDVSGDGRDDIVTGGGPKVNVLLASAAGGFLPAVVYPATDDVAEVRLADLNGDGWLDIAAANSVGPRVSVLLNGGNGIFLPHHDYGPTGDHPESVAVGDLDGDGDADLVFGNAFEDTATVLKNNGLGGFVAGPTASVGDYPEAVALGDLDEDGFSDLAVTGDGELRTLHGNGNGSFEPPVVRLVGATFGSGLEADDLDEDGHVDLVASTGPASMTVLLGHGDGSFDAPLVTAGGTVATELTLGDMNLDGERDVVLVDFPTEGVTVQLGRGDGSFWPHLGTPSSPVGVALALVDGDALLDIVALQNGGSFAIFRGLGNGAFGPPAPVVVPALSNPGSFVAQDVTGDGIVDLAAHGVALSSGQIRVLPGLGNGSFGTPIPVAGGTGVTDLLAADMDGDGRTDLVGSSGAFNAVLVFPGIDGSSWGAPISSPAGLGPSALTAADLDGDGDVDVAVCAAISGSNVAVLLNDGTAHFAAPVALVTGPFPLERGPNAGDLDGDGDVDLVAVDLFGNNLAVFLNDGAGGFSAATHYPSIQNSNDTALGDVDGDGDLDVVLPQMHLFFDDGTVGVLFNDGTGHFAPEVQVTLMADVSGVALGDVNGDGALDVVASVQGANTVSVLLNEDGPWDDVGLPLAGTFGLPHQTGEGTLVGGAPFKFTLSDAKPGGAAYHVVGLFALHAPFKGGVMVPSLNLVNGPLPIDAAGRLVLQGPWVAGVPSGLQLWFQFWFPDNGAPVGFAASNAVKATMPYSRRRSGRSVRPTGAPPGRSVRSSALGGAAAVRPHSRAPAESRTRAEHRPSHATARHSVRGECHVRPARAPRSVTCRRGGRPPDRRPCAPRSTLFLFPSRRARRVRAGAERRRTLPGQRPETVASARDGCGGAPGEIRALAEPNAHALTRSTHRRPATA